MDEEGRKRVIGVMAAILAARKLAQYDRVRMVPATVSAISDTVHWTEEIMKEIDRKSERSERWIPSTKD
jgi:hypothetical protein